MLTYDVYVHRERGYEAVKRGFSWPAFLFGFFWALAKQLWLVAAVYLAVMLAFALSGGAPGDPGLDLLYDLLGFGISLFVGFSGNGWRRQALLQQGYRFLSSVSARSPRDAVQALYGPGDNPAAPL